MCAYLRAPRCGLFTRDCCSFLRLRFGLLIMNVPLPMYSALYSLSFCFSAKTIISYLRKLLSLSV
jgi:hypothetical protein